MRWNAPLSEAHAELLLERLDLRPESSVLDLGCGWGELLIRAVGSAHAGVGVDTAAGLLERARSRATERGLGHRVTLVESAAADWKEPADRVLCVGASHAWEDTRAALGALAQLIRPGDRLLFGDGYWERTPTKAALALFGGGLLRLDELVARARDLDLIVLHLSTADQREWDDFESTWRCGREEWLLAHPAHERAAAVRAELDAQLDAYLGVYRGLLGFCYLILARR
jgi:cyclopropane fatty-acyl-phospholipid synthase-like methyltransferase